MITIIVGIVCFFVGAELENRLWKKDVNELRSLIKELSDFAEMYVSCKATECGTGCGVAENYIHKKTIELVAKAREVVK